MMRPLPYGVALAWLTGLFICTVAAPAGYLYTLEEERREQRAEIVRLQQVAELLQQKKGQFTALDRLLATADSLYRIQERARLEAAEAPSLPPSVRLSSFSLPAPPPPGQPSEAELREADEPVITYRWAASLKSTIDSKEQRVSQTAVTLTIDLVQMNVSDLSFSDTTGVAIAARRTGDAQLTILLDAGEGEQLLRARHLPTGLSVERSFDLRHDHHWTIEQVRRLEVPD